MASARKVNGLRAGAVRRTGATHASLLLGSFRVTEQFNNPRRHPAWISESASRVVVRLRRRARVAATSRWKSASSAGCSRAIRSSAAASMRPHLARLLGDDPGGARDAGVEADLANERARPQRATVTGAPPSMVTSVLSAPDRSTSRLSEVGALRDDLGARGDRDRVDVAVEADARVAAGERLDEVGSLGRRRGSGGEQLAPRPASSAWSSRAEMRHRARRAGSCRRTSRTLASSRPARSSVTPGARHASSSRTSARAAEVSSPLTRWKSMTTYRGGGFRSSIRLHPLRQPVGGGEEEIAVEPVDRGRAAEGGEPALLRVRTLEARADPRAGRREPHDVDAGEGHDEEQRRRGSPTATPKGSRSRRSPPGSVSTTAYSASGRLRRWSISGPTSRVSPITMIPVANRPTGNAREPGPPTVSANAHAPATTPPLPGR